MRAPCQAAKAVVAALGLALLAASAQASEADVESEDASQPSDDTIPLELYTPPLRKELATPVYPQIALSQNREGWVRLEFMVDPNGEPYEIVVSRSMGHEQFEKAAIRALKRSAFEPARVDGKPADAGHSQQYVFRLEGGSKGAARWFVRIYKAAMRVIAEGDRDKADQYIASLEEQTRRNLYEDAYLHVAKYNYYSKWGDKRQQLEALDRAVAHEFGEKNLPEDLFVNCQRARFMLLVNTQDYERALRTNVLLRGYDLDEAVVAALDTVVERINALRLDDRAYTVPGDFGDQTSWSYNLFKDEFFIQAVEGDVAEVKLRCRRGYVFFRFEPDIKYKVDGNDRCHLQLVGNPGTTFTLTQL